MNHQYNKRQNQKELIDDFKSDWIKLAIDKKSIDYCAKFGEYLVSERTTTSQLRNFFEELRRIQNTGEFKDDEIPTSVLMLKPRLAYAAKRSNSNGMRVLYNIFDKKVFSHLDTPDNFDRFVHLMEAIIAYHKFNGAKD